MIRLQHWPAPFIAGVIPFETMHDDWSLVPILKRETAPALARRAARFA